jgi:hypothetical protein
VTKYQDLNVFLLFAVSLTICSLEISALFYDISELRYISTTGQCCP